MTALIALTIGLITILYAMQAALFVAIATTEGKRK